MNETLAISRVSLHSKVAPAPQIVTADLGGEMAILDPESGIYYSLNEVGARIWELLTAAHLPVKIRDLLLQEFDVEAEACEQDLLGLLSGLHECGLIVVEETIDA